MADAESNLVPSEAADQVEVALEEQAAADDGILYLNEYQYENDLVTDFARLVASPRRRGSLYVAAAIAALLGIGMLVAGGSWIKFGVVLIVFGAFLAWWSKNLHHTLARDFIEAVEADESMGGRYRRVAANEDGLMVWGKSGKTAPHVKALVDAHKAMFGDERIGCEPSMDKRTGRPLCDKWTFSTNCVSIQGRYGIPCVGFGPGAESQAHAPNEVTYKDDLVTAAAMYVAALNLYDPSQADGDATVFRAGLTNNKID